VTRGEIFGRAIVPSPPPKPDQAELSKKQTAWRKRSLARLEKARQATGSGRGEWLPVKYVEYDTKSGAGFRLLDDNTLLTDGRGAANETYRILIRGDVKQVAAISPGRADA